MKDETAGGDIAVSEAGSVKRSGHEGDTQRTEKPVEKKNEAEAGKTSDKKNVGQTEGAECVGNAEKPPSEVKKPKMPRCQMKENLSIIQVRQEQQNRYQVAVGLQKIMAPPL